MKFGKKSTIPLSFSVEEYELIYSSEKIDQLSKHKIKREEERIRFTTEGGYTLFFLSLENGSVKLQGLDGYGMRDKEFGKFLKKLISDFKKADNHNE